jgi:hypothetical protein
VNILITSFGAHGHLLPMLRLARRPANVTVAASADMAGVAPDLPFVASGPTVEEIFAENIRRTGVDQSLRTRRGGSADSGQP